MINLVRTRTARAAVTAIATAFITLAAPLALAHGDVTPQAVDVSTLKPLGTDLLSENPYRGNKEAIRVGTSAYNQNCARCHGLEAISGGIAPDLRKLDLDKETDIYFLQSVLRGKVRNGAVYMPPFNGILPQEAIWAIRSYIDTRYEGGAPAADLSPMDKLAKDSACTGCHTRDARSVGPSFMEISKHYSSDKSANVKLLAKVKAGGSGAWGNVPMPAMGGSVTDDNLKKLVTWILETAK